MKDRYDRIVDQLIPLFDKNPDPLSRMATSVALLHHKMNHFFWTGFYRLAGGDLIVGPYQGPLACSILEPRGTGVCWAAVERNESILVPDVSSFEGHIACDSRSASEVVVPVRDDGENLIGVLDVDSAAADAFSTVDVAGLESVTRLIYR